LANRTLYLEVDHRKITPNEFRHLILPNGAVLDPAIEDKALGVIIRAATCFWATAASACSRLRCFEARYTHGKERIDLKPELICIAMPNDFNLRGF